jgi:hypothetical protein
VPYGYRNTVTHPLWVCGCNCTKVSFLGETLNVTEFYDQILLCKILCVVRGTGLLAEQRRWGRTIDQKKKQKESRMFYKMRAKAEPKATDISSSPGFTEWLGTSLVCVLVRTCCILFGRFRISEFAFRWRAKRGMSSSLQKYVWAKFRNANFRKARTDCIHKLISAVIKVATYVQYFLVSDLTHLWYSSSVYFLSLFH